MGINDLFIQFAKYGIIRKPKESYRFRDADLDSFLNLPLDSLYEATAYSFNKLYGSFRNVGQFTPPFSKSWFMLSIILVFLALNGNSNGAKLLNEYNVDNKMLNFIMEYIKAVERLSQKGFLLPKFQALMMTYSAVFEVGLLFSYDAAIIGSMWDYRILENIGNYYKSYTEKELKQFSNIFAEFSKYVKNRFIIEEHF
jgi:hypothetical protein